MFERLRALLKDVAPPDGMTPIYTQIGEPKHAPPAFLRGVLDANADGWGRYPPPAGTDDLRAAIGDWLDRRYVLPDGMIDRATQILPVAGTREALFLAALLVVPPAKGCERPIVLMPNPLYQVYLGAAVAAGAEPVFVPATRENDFQPDLAAVPERTLARTALAYLNSPANPQGSIADAPRLERAIELARTHDFVLAVDECYSEIYTAEPPVGTLAICARNGGDCANVLVFHSLSKRSNVPGLRAGFVAGDRALLARFLTLRQFGGPTVPEPVMAAAAALWRDEAHVEANRALYRAKFDVALAILGGRFGASRPGGGFFLWLDVGDGEAAARRLWREAGLRVLPGAYMARAGADGVNPAQQFIRVALVHDLATTTQAVERLARVLTHVRPGG